MDAKFKNKIRAIKLENFTCFSEVSLDFSSGINVFIGENGTGKTHLLKALLVSTYNIIPTVGEINFQNVFSINDPNLLIRNNCENTSVIMILQKEVEEGYYRTFKLERGSTGFSESGNLNEGIENKVFIPIQEMLSWYKGFTSLYASRFIDFDRTYYDLSVALGLGELRNGYRKDVEHLIKIIEETIGGTVTLEADDRFYIHFDKSGEKHQASIVATGINKLAQILRLIYNGSINKETIIFWDEPTANLNPKYIKVVVQFLQALANIGCQIFVTTHDYLLTQRLSLVSEYRNVQKDVPDMKFFVLYPSENGTKVESGESLIGLERDPILEEYAAVYDFENELFSIGIKAKV